MKDFLTLLDYSSKQLKELIQLGIKLKEDRKKGVRHDHFLAGKSVALIFEKSSTRTRVSFEVGVKELGGYPLFLSGADMQLGRGESVKDTARVLSRYVHGIMIRTYGQERVSELAKYSSIPVINGLTDEYHPCQIMADIMTFYERFGRYEGIRVAYVGDGNNIAHSWMNGAARFGFRLIVASPEGAEPDVAIMERAQLEAEKSGGAVEFTYDPRQAVRNADVVTTDVWASMGQERDAERKRQLLEPYQVNKELMSLAGRDAIFMHCLPAHKGEEVTEEVFESVASAVFDEAENRLHIQKAIMAYLIGKADL